MYLFSASSGALVVNYHRPQTVHCRHFCDFHSAQIYSFPTVAPKCHNTINETQGIKLTRFTQLNQLTWVCSDIVKLVMLMKLTIKYNETSEIYMNVFVFFYNLRCLIFTNSYLMWSQVQAVNCKELNRKVFFSTIFSI